IVQGGGNDRQKGGDTNYSNFSNNRLTIVTGAINAGADVSTLVIGQKPFSNPGASILVSAPGSNVVSTSRMIENDTLTGGDGPDYFVIRKDADSVDTITDFTTGTVEKILLVGFDDITDYSQIGVTQEGASEPL
ncbi:hypothetical protein, partial [Syntrophorhabdus aromaticivorans]|uniref:hypothetical protein n=1 Tax=Syntrophorhabdus aromaticivorans TaxID=328301 RepID=UPI00055F6F22